MQRSPTCPSCCQCFGTKDPARPRGPRIPLLLHCGHTYCEGCLTKIAKQTRDKIKCPDCPVETPLKDGDGSVKSLWPNVYILGILAFNRRCAQDQNELNFAATGMLHLQKKQQKEDNTETEMCGECNIHAASCRCVKCECNMCGLCFEKVHKVSKTLRKHQAVPMYDDYSQDKASTCATHDGRTLEYFCEEDQTAICAHCYIVGEHKNHNIMPLEAKSKMAVSLLQPALNKASSVYKQLQRTDEVLSAAIPDMKLTTNQLAEEMRGHFQLLHGALQAREVALIRELEEVCRSEMTPLEELRMSVMDNIRKLGTSINDASKIVNNNSTSTLNAQIVLDKLESVKELPCHIKDTEPQKDQELRWSFDKTLLKDMFDYGKVTGSKQERFTLESFDEMDPDVVSKLDLEQGLTTRLESLERKKPKSWYEQVAGSEESSECESVGSATTCSSRDSYHSKRSLKKIRVHMVRQELVYVTHIKSPCEFMVQRCADAERLKALAKSINKFCSKENAGKPNTLEEGDLVLAQYSLDETWYRAQVKEIIADPETTMPPLVVPKARLLYVDYGNSEIVEIDKIRKMQNQFMRLPEMSVQCTLVDIVPADPSGQWPVEAVHTFAKMTEDKPMLMNLLGHANNVMKVDLSKPPLDDIEDDRPVSLRDTLVFLELACFTTEYSIPLYPGGPIGKQSRQFLSLEHLPRGEVVEVLISHVNSPVDFYIQQIGDEAKYLTEMMDELQTTYSQDTGDLYTIFCPHKDQICVAQYSLDTAWYRAKVIELPGRRNVVVRYVDFGNEELVSHWKMRKVLDKFTKLPEQAVHCCFADVEPIDTSQGWTEEALLFMGSLAASPLMLEIKEYENSHAKVVLYDPMSDGRVTLNSMLVQAGHAKSIGASSVVPVSLEPELTPALNIDVEAAANYGKQEVENKHKQTKTSKKKHKAVPETPEDHETPHIAVRVSHIQNPGHFYVQLASAGKEGLDSLQKELQEVYANSESVIMGWQPEDYCAAIYSKDQLWYRAKVVKLHSDDVAEVFLIDVGYRDTVKFSLLRPLQEKFQAQPCFSIRCHLTGIQPAGDITKWSRTACEYLEETVGGIKCYIVQQGDIVEGSLPIDILIREIILGTALSSDKIEYKEVSQMLKDKGLALPVRSEIKRPLLADSKLSTVTRPPSQLKIFPSEPESTKADKTEAESGVSSLEAGQGDACKINPLPEKLDINGDQSNEVPYKKIEKVYFMPPLLPETESVALVPTYIDFNGVIYAHRVHDVDSPRGKYGHYLKENTLETILQDAYLSKQELYRGKIPRDGNCLFRAFAEGLYQDQSKHTDLRDEVIRMLDKNWVTFSNVIGEQDKHEYLSEMIMNGTYGGEPEIRAVCMMHMIHTRVYIGGLDYPVQARDYGHCTDGIPTIELIYISDGDYDNGHYDIVLNDPVRAEDILKHYSEWRKERMYDLQSPELDDHSTYDDSLLSQLMEKLEKYYRDSEPDLTAEWEIDQGCIVQFSQDNLFYRGRISNITDSGYEVFYIDFGNTETVAPEMLRHDVILASIPQQCIECKISDLKPATPNGKWVTKVLDYIHNLAVGQSVGATIKGTPACGELLETEFTLPDGRDLATVLCEAGFALRLDQDPAILEKSEEETENKEFVHTVVPFERKHSSPFRQLEGFKPGEFYIVSVTQVDFPDVVHIQHVKQPEVDDATVIANNNELDSLLNIASELDEKAESFPQLKCIKPGQACCAQYTADGHWYRTEILTVEIQPEKRIGVLYVDYGTSEYIHPSSARCLPKPFLELRAQSVRIKLPQVNFVNGENQWSKDASLAMTEALVNKVLIAEILSVKPDLCIDLYKQDADGKYSLAYDEVIAKGFITAPQNTLATSNDTHEEKEENIYGPELNDRDA